MDTTAAITLIEHALPGVTTIYLFGSQANGLSRPDSDVDLAVLQSSPIDQIARWNLQEAIASALHADVDLVDLASASAVMRVQVLDGARLLLDKDPHARAQFEMYALSDYARLNEERREILNDIKKRGTVYG